MLQFDTHIYKSVNLYMTPNAEVISPDPSVTSSFPKDRTKGIRTNRLWTSNRPRTPCPTKRIRTEDITYHWSPWVTGRRRTREVSGTHQNNVLRRPCYRRTLVEKACGISYLKVLQSGETRETVGDTVSTRKFFRPRVGTPRRKNRR